jgi:hypothetical protein
MTTMSEFGPEVEAELRSLRKRMRRALKAGDMALYASLKAEHVTRVHVEQRRVQRAARALREALEPARPERWKLPFRWSPGAVERDRRPPEPEKPMVPAGGHLSPWRRSGHPGSEVIWRM